MSSTKIPPETVQVFRQRPLGLQFGNRNGINYVYAVDKPKPPPPKSDSNNNNSSRSGKITTMAQMQYDKLIGLISKRILKVQEIDVQLYSLRELSDLINSEKLPLYITFAEDIGIFEDLEKNKFDPSLHLQYFKAMVTKPPSQYSAMDVQRMTLLFFSIFAIDILCDIKIYYNSNNKLKKEKIDIINWIYAQQIISNPQKGIKYAGFRGGSFIGMSFDNNSKNAKDRIYLEKWDRVNMASTHNAICMLIGLGDNLDRLDKKGIIETIKMLQDPLTGSFSSMIDGEIDMRFIYCACVISHLLNDWNGININKACLYIINCQSYDGSLSFGNDLEGHGGSTFVGCAALILMNKLHKININSLLRWLIFNQGNGFKGRPEKPADSCYSFWCGAVLSMLSSYKQNGGKINNKINNNNEYENKNENDENIMNLIDLKQFYHCDNKEFY
eukprot:235976_1